MKITDVFPNWDGDPTPLDIPPFKYQHGLGTCPLYLYVYGGKLVWFSNDCFDPAARSFTGRAYLELVANGEVIVSAETWAYMHSRLGDYCREHNLLIAESLSLGELMAAVARDHIDDVLATTAKRYVEALHAVPAKSEPVKPLKKWKVEVEAYFTEIVEAHTETEAIEIALVRVEENHADAHGVQLDVIEEVLLVPLTREQRLEKVVEQFVCLVKGNGYNFTEDGGTYEKALEALRQS